MNRRRFLLFASAAAAVPLAARFLPTLPVPLPMSEVQDPKVWMSVDLAAEGADATYVAFIHPSQWRNIYELYGRGRWQAAWREYRKARKKGLCNELSAQAVMERYAERPITIPASGEIGSYESFRFIKSAPEALAEALKAPALHELRRDRPAHRALLRNRWER